MYSEKSARENLVDFFRFPGGVLIADFGQGR